MKAPKTPLVTIAAKMGGDRDMSHKSSASFGEFLDAHANISKDLSKNPSLAKNQEYMANHPELKEYLNAHPEVRQELMANPQSFVASAQQFNNSKNGTPVKKP
jgi:peptidoglycan hydrolase CwlO-like protein